MGQLDTKGGVLTEGKVRPQDMTTVYSTDVDKFHTTGDPIECHVELAKKLIEQGKATAEPPKAGKKQSAE